MYNRNFNLEYHVFLQIRRAGAGVPGDVAGRVLSARLSSVSHLDESTSLSVCLTCLGFLVGY